MLFVVHLLYANTKEEESKRDVRNKEDRKLKEIKALRRWISSVDNDVRRKIARRQPTKRQTRNSRTLVKKYGKDQSMGGERKRKKLVERLRKLITRRKQQRK